MHITIPISTVTTLTTCGSSFGISVDVDISSDFIYVDVDIGVVTVECSVVLHPSQLTS